MLFYVISKFHIVDIEYMQGVYLPIFFVEEFYGLFAIPSTFLIKVQGQHKTFYPTSYID